MKRIKSLARHWQTAVSLLITTLGTLVTTLLAEAEETRQTLNVELLPSIYALPF